MQQKYEAIILSQFRQMQATMPNDYLKRNHIQYEYVSYISLVFSLFISEVYEGSGRFILRAKQSYNQIGKDKFSDEYIAKSDSFLTLVADILINEKMVSAQLCTELSASKD